MNNLKINQGKNLKPNRYKHRGCVWCGVSSNESLSCRCQRRWRKSCTIAFQACCPTSPTSSPSPCPPSRTMVTSGCVQCCRLWNMPSRRWWWGAGRLPGRKCVWCCVSFHSGCHFSGNVAFWKFFWLMAHVIFLVVMDDVHFFFFAHVINMCYKHLSLLGVFNDGQGKT